MNKLSKEQLDDLEEIVSNLIDAPYLDDYWKERLEKIYEVLIDMYNE